MNEILSLYESTETNLINIATDEKDWFKFVANSSRDGMDETERPAFGFYLKRDCINISN